MWFIQWVNELCRYMLNTTPHSSMGDRLPITNVLCFIFFVILSEVKHMWSSNSILLPMLAFPDMFVEVIKHGIQRWGGSCLRFVLSAFNQTILNSGTSLLCAITTVWMCVKDEFTGNSFEGLFTNQHTSLNLQSGAMIMATTTELVRSGTVVLRTVTWWAAPVWATGKESSSVNPVSKAKFFNSWV